MFRLPLRVTVSTICFPRVRGDVPSELIITAKPATFSPRARGCSQLAPRYAAGRVVFPACAGMFRLGARYCMIDGRFPRVRGDVPIEICSMFAITPFSPRARGCSSLPCFWVKDHCVFPACAGMFRCGKSSMGLAVRFPRVRGDVPRPREGQEALFEFSPRARGCSV